MHTDTELARKSLLYRREILRVIRRAGAGHTGGDLSCIDILNVLYNRVLRVAPADFSDPDRDRYVQSKGHSVEALYVVLADRGFFPAAALDTLSHYRSHFAGHPTRDVPGIEQNTGALGHGLPIATGMAIAGKLDSAAWRVFTLLGDGELAEGSNWEAAMAAAHYKLDNLTAIVDCNTLQITGRTRDVMGNEPLDAKWAAFGWAVRRVPGHDLGALTAALSSPPEPGRPRVFVADTRKGSGISFMEDAARWHHGVPTDDEYKRALAELDARLAQLEGAAA
ncbi:MAG: transketolase [Opitutaceae bacterium]|jgi:transketolase|nr:transketolase [Opitutaceae bacterium]